MTEYDYLIQKDISDRHEAELDVFFRRLGYEVTIVDKHMQDLGVDRIFNREKERWTVEYKADSTADRTLRIFVETISNIQYNKPGWANKSTADWLVYYLPERQHIFVYDMQRVKKDVLLLIKGGEAKQIRNKDKKTGYVWHSEGTPVPINRFTSYLIKYIKYTAPADPNAIKVAFAAIKEME